MKLISKILSLLVLPGVMMFTSCDKNDDSLPSNLYQEYQILVENGNASAFANIREGGATGNRVKVTESRLTVNMIPMYYETPAGPTDPEFTNFANLASNHTKAIFRFKNSKGKTLVNTSEYGDLPEVKVVGNPYNVTGGETLEIELNGAFVDNINAYLVGASAISKPIEVPVMSRLDFASPYADIILPQGSGIYDLILDYVVEEPVTQGDASASGKITTIVRSRRSLKF